jgi:hypothetical protein
MRGEAPMIVGRYGAVLNVAAMAATAISLLGCAGDRARLREERINSFPDNYRTDLLGAMHAYVADPSNIRDAYLSEPVLRQIGAQNRYTVCLRFNAKDSDGRYVGSRDAMAIFLSGRFDQFVDLSQQSGQQATAAEQAKEACAQADYKRFPELEALKR